MATIAFAGNYAGTIVSMPVSGILANKIGWESCFYVFGNEIPIKLHCSNNCVVSWSKILKSRYTFELLDPNAPKMKFL